MKVKNLLIVSILILFLVGCGGKADNQLEGKDPLSGGEMMFWKVSDDDSSVYLLGSIHFGKAEFYPMPNVVETAYTESQVLGVEIDISSLDENAVQKIIMDNMYYQDGTKLIDHLSQETVDILTEYLKEKDMDITMFESMKPGMLILTISVLESQLAGLDEELGIDKHYITRAIEDDKKIVEFESIEEQMGMLFGSDKISEGLLYKTLKESQDFQTMLDSLITLWQTGDAKAMNTFMTSWETPEEKQYLDMLFGERDIKMTEKIEEMLADNTKAFIILGAGHYVNDDGIINRLNKSKKYKIVKY